MEGIDGGLHLAMNRQRLSEVNCEEKYISSVHSFLWKIDRLVGLVVKASASRAEGLELKSRLRRDFFGAESYQ